MKKKESWLNKKMNAVTARCKKDRVYKRRMIIAWALLLTVWTGVVFYLSQFVIVLVAQWFINATQWEINLIAAQTVCVALSNTIAVIVATLVSKKLFRRVVTRDSLGLKGMPTWTDVLLSPIGYIVSTVAGVFVIMVLQAVIRDVDWTQAQDVGFNSVYSSADRIITFVALVIVAPITEELMFRGFLYGRLRTKLSAVPAIILVSVLFGVLHGQWNVGVIVCIMSVFMCIARELTGTIYAGILMHMIRNGIAFYLLYVNPIMGAMAGCATLWPFLV